MREARRSGARASGSMCLQGPCYPRLLSIGTRGARCGCVGRSARGDGLLVSIVLFITKELVVRAGSPTEHEADSSSHCQQDDRQNCSNDRNLGHREAPSIAGILQEHRQRAGSDRLRASAGARPRGTDHRDVVELTGQTRRAYHWQTSIGSDRGGEIQLQDARDAGAAENR